MKNYGELETKIRETANHAVSTYAKRIIVSDETNFARTINLNLEQLIAEKLIEVFREKGIINQKNEVPKFEKGIDPEVEIVFHKERRSNGSMMVSIKRSTEAKDAHFKAVTSGRLD